MTTDPRTTTERIDDDWFDYNGTVLARLHYQQRKHGATGTDPAELLRGIIALATDALTTGVYDCGVEIGWRAVGVFGANRRKQEGAQ